MARWVEFHDQYIHADSVTAVGKIDTFKTGSQSCDWAYGFTIITTGNKLEIIPDRPRSYGYAGGLSRDEYKDLVKRLRSEFVGILDE